MDVPSTPPRSPADAATDFWFLNSFATFVADPAGTQCSFASYRGVAPPEFVMPYHTHEAYGEGFYVLDGEVTFYWNGTKIWLAKGGFIFLPEPSP